MQVCRAGISQKKQQEGLVGIVYVIVTCDRNFGFWVKFIMKKLAEESRKGVYQLPMATVTNYDIPWLKITKIYSLNLKIRSLKSGAALPPKAIGRIFALVCGRIHLISTLLVTLPPLQSQNSLCFSFKRIHVIVFRVYPG